MEQTRFLVALMDATAEFLIEALCKISAGSFCAFNSRFLEG